MSPGTNKNSDEVNSTPLAIQDLTVRMARGDEAAYRDFCERYCIRLLRYLVVLTRGRQETAEDALQLTLLRVVRNIKPFPSEEIFWSWLTVLARSSVVDETRKQTRHAALLERFFKKRLVENPGPNHVDSRLLALLEGNLTLLSEEERTLIERKYFADERVRTIASTTDSTEKAIESKLVRIRRKLRETILTQLNDEEPDRS